jgi:Zn-dependent protease
MEPLLGLAKYLAYINMALVLFNLIPGYPLDGGRVFRAIVWAITGNMGRSTLIAANVGRFFAFLLIFAGVWQMFSGNFGGGLASPCSVASQVLCPPLHHSPTIRHPLRSVVDAPHFVSFNVRKLAFNPVTVQEVALI